MERLSAGFLSDTDYSSESPCSFMLCVIAKQLARIAEKIMLRDNRLPVFFAGGKM